MKNQLPLDSQELQDPIIALQKFFDDMTQWEQLAERKRVVSRPEIEALFSRQVSWKPRPGWRPVHLSWMIDNAQRAGMAAGHFADYNGIHDYANVKYQGRPVHK